MFWPDEATERPIPEASQFTAPTIPFAEVTAEVKTAVPFWVIVPEALKAPPCNKVVPFC
jgi:hypothetical protein